MNLAQQLFKHSRPVLRDFIPMSEDGAGDVPYLWDAYLKGLLEDLPEGLTMAEFADVSFEILDLSDEAWISEDMVTGEMQPIGFIMTKFDGWQAEPHMLFFDNASVRNKLRTWVAFLKKTRRSKRIGACLIRVDDSAKKMANRMEQMKILKYVGRVWAGRPNGNEYLYSMRCARRH